MAEPWPLLVLASGCLLTITVALILIARDCHETLRRLNALLPAAERALEEVGRALRSGRRVLGSAERASRHVETVVHEACEAAAGSLGRLVRIGERVRKGWVGQFGNGAGSGPRRHHRGR